jgi:hypothetical protein
VSLLDDGTYRAGKGPPTHVRASVNGSAQELLITRSHPRRGGGRRGRVTGFSAQSRRRFIRKLASIDEKAYRPNQVLFISITYHRTWPEDPAVQYGQLKRWHRRVERRYGPIPLFWKKELQRRGAPHYHLVVFLPAELATERRIGEFVDFATESWIDVVAGPSDCRELMARHALRCTRKGSWRSLITYASKRMSNTDEAGDGRSTGRIWGSLRAKELPVSHEIVPVTYPDFLRLRRTFGKIAEAGQGRHRRRGGRRGAFVNQHVLLSYPELARLLNFLGYRLL